jgi:cytochrome b561
MSLKSTSNRYGSVAITIHWASAVGVIGALTTGLLAAGTADPAAEVVLVRGHIVLGTAVLLLTLFRICWWIWGDQRPQSVAGQPAAQEWAARIVHGAIYVTILLMASSGITTIILSGALPSIIAGTALPDFSEIVPRIAHGIMSRLMIALLVAHVAAALYHQFIRRDRLLGRMGLGAV